MKKARIHPDSTYTDKYLWDLIRADSVDAFNEVYNRYWDLVFRVTLKRLHVKEIVEEIVQDAFIVLWEKRHELQVDSLKNYLLAITRYAVFHYISRQQTITARMNEMRQEEQTTNNNIEDIVNSRLLLQLVNSIAEELPEKFSFEKDYLEKFYKERRMYGVVQDEYFIDIGIPEDFERAQKEMQ